MIGFFDEASPQTTSNTVRKWSPKKPKCVKNTDKIKANAMGFYAINGGSSIEFPQRSRSEDICEAFRAIRNANGSKPVIVILDNFRAHHSKRVAERAEELNIIRVFLPPYSPHLNPIEFVWKFTKRTISKTRIISRDHMTSLIEDAFMAETSKTSYFAYWKDLFLSTVCLNI